MLYIQVGTTSSSPLMWAIEIGSMEAAHAIVVDLLTFRVDRQRDYYGMDTTSRGTLTSFNVCASMLLAPFCHCSWTV